MRRLGRCSFVVLGLPNIISFAIVASLATFTLPMVPTDKRPFLLAVVDVLSGIVSIFFGSLVARCFGFPETLWVPLVSLLWFAVHFARLNRVNEFIRVATGMLLGWWLYEYSLV